ncbi:uncharacterized protein P174DRAFT_417181 [Aspergillus novofumigatus IBT 16806]|uniref:Uncharacterized protein n=1 Tax=Aspergillus novofumigatus (strain IBT 16806) TaxID=1392255 RepID=A0A2I1CPI7_ASPN1|nr:uncharacterized protein P174DRAFT_417181 [Aspergillus novofumigatus IBT 16806]PKX99518.1 hypothetical protein P174DRAFT_417181 [Aspergillus novofumigatus IBT 16806]
MSTFSITLDVERHETSRTTTEEDRSAGTRWLNWCSGGWKKISSALRLMLRPVAFEKSGSAGFVLDVHKRAAQCCFLCLQSRNGSYAVQVPCIRPKEPRVIKRIVAKIPRPDGGKVYEKLSDKEKAFESDAAIWARMKEVYYADKGKWKAWLPFYGPTSVREVEFQFVGTEEQNGRFKIFDVKPVDVERLRQEADDIIASAPGEVDFDYGNGCMGSSHSTKCDKSIEYDRPCILQMANEARQRKRKLDMLHLLKDCIRDPLTANGLRTLDGMAQDSCIYELEYVTPCFDDRDSNLSYPDEKTALPFRNATVRTTEQIS